MHTLIKTAIFAAFIIAATGCKTLPYPLEASNQFPNRFYFSSGVDSVGTDSLMLDGNQIVRTHSNPPFQQSWSEHITPTRESWSVFWREIQAIDLWRWRPRYDYEWLHNSNPPPPKQIATASWSIEIDAGNHHMHSSGTYVYPADADPRKISNELGVPTQRFEHLEEALSRLIGEPVSVAVRIGR